MKGNEQKDFDEVIADERQESFFSFLGMLFVGTVLLFLLGAFACWSFNVPNWPTSVRIILAILEIIWIGESAFLAFS